MAEKKNTTRLVPGQLVQWNREWLKSEHLDISTATHEEEPGVVQTLTFGGAIIRWANGCEVSLLEYHIEPLENGDQG